MKRSIISGVSLTAMMAVSAGAVFAQESASGPVLDQIMVTASKRGAQSLQSIPMTIQAFSGDQLERQGISDFADYARSISGLSFDDRGPGDKKYVLRGIQSTGAATTGVYFDDIVITGANRQDGGGRQPDIRLVDMERLEVLKGPQGTLYGASSMSGTIRMITNKPDPTEVSGAFNGSLGTTRHAGGANYSFDGMLNVPIIEDKLAVRVVAYDSHDAGFIDNAFLGQKGVDSIDVTGGRIALRGYLSDDITVDLMFIHQQTKADGPAWYQPYFGDLVQYTHGDTPWDENLDAYNAAIEWDVGSGTVTATASYMERDILYVQPATRKLCNIFGNGPQACNETIDSPTLQSTLGGLDQPQDRSVFSSELRYASAWEGPFQIVGGVFYQKEKANFLSTVYPMTPEGVRIPGDDVSYVNRRVNGDIKQYAAFGEASYDITSDLTATFGIRAFRFEIGEVGQNLVTRFRPVAQDAVVTESTDEDVTFKFNLAYNLDDDTLIYATYAEGFRSGGNNEPDLVSGQVFPPFSSDSLKSYELGIKGSFFDKMLQLDAAVYYIDWQDLQARVSENQGQSSYLSNVGAAEITGVEVGAVLYPTDGLTLGGNVTVMDPQLAEDDPLTLTGRVPGLKGDQIPGVPKFTANAYADYTFPVGGDWNGIARVDYSYVGKSYTDFRPQSPNYRPQGDYSLVNARLTFEDSESYRVSLFVNNVFDTSPVLSWFLDVQRPDMAIPLRPRTIGLDAGIKF